MLKIVWLLFFFLSVPAFAEEVDDFSPAPKAPRDAAPIIDIATNALLDELVDLLNKSHLSHCEDKTKYQLALKKLDQNFTAIGNGLRAGKELRDLFELIQYDPSNRAKHQNRLLQVQETWLAEFPPEKRDWFAHLFSSVQYFGPQDNKGSIYENLDFLTCCTSRININGIYVGLDKIDHFFGNGGLLYEQFLFMDPKIPLNKRLEELMQINVRQEHSLWGLKGLSPKSYGDLAANWQGVHFYRQLYDSPTAYIQCVDGAFKRHATRRFHITDYLDEAWNESTNCSSFSSKKELELFLKNLKLAGMQCPRDRSMCVNLVRKYRGDPLFLQHAISPLCSGQPTNFSPIETPIPISWDEVELSFRGFTWPIIKDLARKKWETMITRLRPRFFKDQSTKDGEKIFSQLKSCQKAKNDERVQCLQKYTEPGLSPEQLSKFSSILDAGIDFSELVRCPASSERLEKLLHPVPIGDMSFCFLTHYRQGESLGRVYFRRHKDELKVVLLRM